MVRLFGQYAREIRIVEGRKPGSWYDSPGVLTVLLTIEDGSLTGR